MLLMQRIFEMESNVGPTIELKGHFVVFVYFCHAGLALFELASNRVMFCQYRSPRELATVFRSKVREGFYCMSWCQ